MADVSVPNTLAAGTVIRATPLNQNYAALVNYINARNDGSTAWDNIGVVLFTASGAAVFNGAVTFNSTVALPAGSVDATALAASVAGNGLAGGGGVALSVNVGTGLEISSDTVRIAAAVAGGLTGGGGSALAVNVDNSTLEINTNTLRVKDAGITQAKLATAVVNKLGQNIGLIARLSTSTSSNSFVDIVNYTGQGRLLGFHYAHANGGAGTHGGEVKLIVDGVDFGAITITATTSGFIKFGAGNSTTMFQIDASGDGFLNELEIFFKTSLQLQHRCSGSSVSDTMTSIISYERAA